MKSSNVLLAFLVAAVAAAPIQAAKVIRLFNPWGADSTVSLGLPMGQNVSVLSFYPVAFDKGADSSLLKVVPGTPWLQWVSRTALPAGFTFVRDDWSSYAPDGLGGKASFDLTTLWATSDTVWIVPGPLPTSAATVTTTAPKQLTVFLWNPWEGQSASAPSVQVQGGAWLGMYAVAGHPGWYSRHVLGLTSASLLFRDSTKAGYSYFAATGVSGPPLPMVLDTLWKRGDSIWVIASPEPSGQPKGFSAWPKPKVVEIFNPWDGSPALDLPRVQFAGDTTHYATVARKDLCGWNERIWYDRPSSIVVSSSVSGQTWGSGGLGTTGMIDLSAVLATQDTVWVARDVSGKPVAGFSWDGTQGQCLLVMLAGTIRDFNSTDSSFNNNAGCGAKGYVQSTLGAGRKPVPTGKIDKGCNPGDSLRMARYWFTTDPTYVQNAETCRDIPLQLEPNGNYTYANPYFFPIDDFTTLANGKPNPFAVMSGGEDNKPHNFSFCMEMHGTFDFRAGQKFNFVGDDDVWCFIDNRLVVDLGGVHMPETASVNLDTLKLVAGQSYPWDLFYCERHTSGSSIKISTSMNLRTLPTFLVADSTLGESHHRYTLWVNTKNGASCATSAAQRSTVGLYTLTGTGLVGTQVLTSGKWYGGIGIPNDLGSVELDSAAMVGLAPGKYVLHISLPGSGGVLKDVPFTVADFPSPRYVNPVVDSGLAGVSFPVQVVAMRSGRRDSAAIGFRIPPPVGLSVFRDSLLTIPVGYGDTLRTVPKGEPVRLWVAGLQTGSWKLVLRNVRGDSVDVWPFVVLAPPPPAPRFPRYLNPVPFSAVLGTATYQDVVAFQNGLRDTSSIAFLAGPVAGLSVFRDSLLTIPVGARDTLRTGIKGESLRLWVKGGQVGSWNLVLRTEQGDSSDVWNFTVTAPIPLVPRYLDPSPYAGAVGTGTFLDVFTTQSGKRDTVSVGFRLVPPAGLTLFADSLFQIPLGVSDTLRTGARGEPLRVWVQGTKVGSWNLVLRDASGDSVDVSPNLAFSGRGIRFTDSTGTLTSLPALVADVHQAVPVFLQSFIGLGLCTTCADSVTMVTGNVGLRMVAFPGGPEISGVRLSAGVAKFWVVSGHPIDSTRITAQSDSALFPVDRSPVRVRAPRLVFVDSLGREIAPTPALALAMGERRKFQLEVRTSMGLCVDCFDTVSLASSSTRLLFQDALGNPISRIVLAGGKASFSATGWAPVVDVSVSADAYALRAVADWKPISVLAPVVSGLLTDSDVDGRADLIELVLSLDAGLFQAVRIQWPDTNGVLDSRRLEIDTSGQKLTLSIPPFAFGATSCPGSGCVDLGRMEVHRGTDTALIPFEVRDGVVPVIFGATLRYASSTSIRDTLRVRVSEPLQPSLGKPWVSWGRASLDSLGTAVDPDRGGLLGDRRDLYFLVDTTFLPRPQDSIRLTASPSGAASDVFGNVPLRFAHWAPVNRGPYPPNLRWVVQQGFRAGNGQNPVTEPDLQILAKTDRGDWNPIGQGAPNQSPDEYTGLRLHLTKGVRGSVYVYDNLGVFVGGLPIPSLDREIDEKVIASDSRGNAWIWLAWNGRSKGKALPGGVYLMRVLLMTESEPSRFVLNQVFPLALRRSY
ncbi:MAG: fibro-slime domain-containing protein [Fibrobacteres bacterium]|nr:fibro-slime domain-containing protein [Fibrobacterota bacterium]